MSTVQFVSTSPEELAEMISLQVKTEIQLLLANQEKQEAPNEYLTPEETCNLLSITKPTLWRYVKRGTVKKYTFENKVYYRRSEIENGFTNNNE